MAACLWFWRFGRFQQSGFRHRSPDLLHAVDELHGGDRRQDQAACRIAPARDRGIGLNLIDTAHRKFNAQRLSVKEHAGDRIGESFDQLRPINVAEARGLAGRRWDSGPVSRGASGRRGSNGARVSGVFCSLAFRALSSCLAVFIARSFFALCRKISRAERNCKPPLFELFLIFSYFVLCVYARLAVAVAAGPARQRGRGWGDPDAVRD